MLFAAIVAFPTCLFAAAIVLTLVPKTSPLWRPPVAATIGTVTGPIAMYFWAMLFVGGSAPIGHPFFYGPDWSDFLVRALTGASALVGGVFAYSYARFKKKHEIQLA